MLVVTWKAIMGSNKCDGKFVNIKSLSYGIQVWDTFETEFSVCYEYALLPLVNKRLLSARLKKIYIERVGNVKKTPCSY